MKRLYIASMMTALVLTQTGCGGSGSSQPTAAQSAMLSTCASQSACLTAANCASGAQTGAICTSQAGGLIPGSNGGTVTVPSLPTGGTGTSTSTVASQLGLVPTTSSSTLLRAASVNGGNTFDAASVVDSSGKPNYENIVQGVNNVVSGQATVSQAATAYKDASAGSGASQ